MGELTASVARYVEELCLAHPDRHVGGDGNRAATRLFKTVVGELGFDIETVEFDCLEWRHGCAWLDAGGVRVDANVGPYSLPFSGHAPLHVASSLADLDREETTGAIALLTGELVREQLMPKSFEFYNPEEHRRIVAALERRQPAAIVAATGVNHDMAGALYPFPLIEDGDIDIPSAYIRDVEGALLVQHAGEPVQLRIESERLPARAEQLIARLPGRGPHRVVVLAHIDSKKGAPGALDNATGVSCLLALASLLARTSPEVTVELVPINGEDYYAQPGEHVFLGANQDRFEEIVLGVNVDGIGCAGHETAVSLYDCPEALTECVESALAQRDGLFFGDPWYQGDHALFMMNSRPALALTSANAWEIVSEIAHTPRDVPALVDPEKVAEAARFLADVVASVGKLAGTA